MSALLGIRNRQVQDDLFAINSLYLWVRGLEPAGVTFGEFFTELERRYSEILARASVESRSEIEARLMGILALCHARGLLAHPWQSDQLISSVPSGRVH